LCVCVCVCVCVCESVSVYQGCTNPWPQDVMASIFLRWRLKSVAPHYGMVFLSPFWRLEF